MDSGGPAGPPVFFAIPNPNKERPVPEQTTVIAPHPFIPGEDEEVQLAHAARKGEPGELGALACKLYDENPNLTEEEAYEAFIGWVESRGIELWLHQEEALMSIMVGDHVILGTPTGSGKSLVALGMHFIAMCFGERSYYTAPIKALVSEKFFNLVDILGRENVGMITGDVHINTSAPVICCTEEILANQALAEGKDAPIESVAMDEFHFFSDSDRGWAWQVPLLALPNVQFLLMSATLGDVDQIAGLIERQTGKDVSRIIDAPRPVPLSYEYALTSLEGTVELALRKGEGPLYVVHFSQDAALSSASALASYGVATKEQREAVKEAMKGARFTTAFGKTLKRLLGCGVGVHHAGMLPRYRLLVEKLAQQGSPSSVEPTRSAWASTCPSTPSCSPRSRSSTATRCAVCARASSTRSRGARGDRASTLKAWSSPRRPSTRSRTTRPR